MADPKAKLGKAVAGCNYVATDQVWKSRVRKETTTSKSWPESWGFMSQDFGNLVGENVTKRDRPKRDLPTPLRLPPITPIEKYIKVKPSPMPVPNTTSKNIGWRSSHPEFSLECYGAYAKGKGGLIRQLKWPLEGII